MIVNGRVVRRSVSSTRSAASIQAHDLGNHISLRNGSRPVPEQDLAIAEGNTRGLEAMAERVLEIMHAHVRIA